MELSSAKSFEFDDIDHIKNLWRRQRERGTSNQEHKILLKIVNNRRTTCVSVFLKILIMSLFDYNYFKLFINTF